MYQFAVREHGICSHTSPNLQQELDISARAANAFSGIKGVGRKAAAPGIGMDECALMQRAYHVVVGLSWGTLPPLLQQRWTQLHCDQQVLNILG